MSSDNESSDNDSDKESKIETESGIKFKLDDKSSTATVVSSPKIKAVETLTIPSFVSNNGKQYKVVAIGQHAFMDAKIKYLNFEDNTEIKTFEDDSLYCAKIQKLQIPASLCFLEGSCFRSMDTLKEIELSPKNQRFQIIDGKYLVGKSNEKSKEYDILHFVYSTDKEFIVPSEIKLIKEFAFDGCDPVSIIFNEDSKLKEIERDAISNQLKKYVLPASVEKIEESNWTLYHLTDFQISPQNKTFKFVDNKYLCKKSSGSDTFDKIVFVPRNIEVIKIPSYIKTIAKHAFTYCEEITEFSFEPNSSLSKIEYYGFAHSVFPDDKIVFPESLKYVGMTSLAGIKGATSIEFLGSKIAIEHCAFNMSSIEHLLFPNAKTIELKSKSSLDGIENAEFVVHKDVKIIGDGKSSFPKKPTYYEDKKEHKKSKDKKHHKKSKDKSDSKQKSQYDNHIIKEDQDKIVKIGFGPNSESFKVEDETLSLPIFKKVYKIDSLTYDDDEIQKEYDTISSINHPCICRFLQMKKDEDEEEEERKYKKEVAFYFEYLYTNLNDFLSNPLFNNTLKMKIAMEIAFGMSFLHHKGIVHKNLKIDNVLLNSIFEAKIVGYGPSFSDDDNSFSVDSIVFVSPELQSGKDVDEKTDVYSYGVILHALFLGRLPKQTLKDKLDGEQIEVSKTSPSIWLYCVDLVRKCLAFDPKKRPSFDEIIDSLRENDFQVVDGIDMDVINSRYAFLKALQEE